jgi:hypothetical protein
LPISSLVGEGGVLSARRIPAFIRRTISSLVNWSSSFDGPIMSGLSLINDADNDAFRCVYFNRFNLNRFASNFHRSVELFRHMEPGTGGRPYGVLGSIFNEYQMIAAKDGALTLYHF